jgi:cholesterol transport system auxiliary component
LTTKTATQACARTLLPLALTLLVAGCGLFRGPPPVTYELTAPESIPALRAGTTAQIMIPEPRALKALDSERIVVNSDARISYYPDAQWADRLPAVLQAKAIQAFEQSKRARAVGRPGEGLSIDYQLLIDIRAFEFNTSIGNSYARIEVFAKILNDRNGRVVAQRVLTGSAPVYRDDARNVVAALDAALNQVLVELVSWTVSKV